MTRKKRGIPRRYWVVQFFRGTKTVKDPGYGTELGHELSFDVREGKIIKIRLRSYYEFPQHFYR